MKKIIEGPTIKRFSELFDIPVKEVVYWIDGYVNCPESMFSDQLNEGFIEDSENERFSSIAEYIKRRIEETADSRIKADLSKKEMAAA